MFGLDEFAEQLSDAEQTVGGQRHEDDDDGRYVAGDHLVSRRLVFPRGRQLLVLLLRHSHHGIIVRHQSL